MISSSPSLSSLSSFPPHHLTSTPSNTPRINTGLIRGGWGCRVHRAASAAGRKKQFVTAPSASPYFCVTHLWFSPTPPSLTAHKQPRRKSNRSSSSLPLSLLIFRDEGVQGGVLFHPQGSILTPSTRQFFIIFTVCVNSKTKQGGKGILKHSLVKISKKLLVPSFSFCPLKFNLSLMDILADIPSCI